MLMTQRIFLVTGAGGFIGANLCRRLVQDGQTVHAFVKPGSDTWRIDGILGDIRVHEVDICNQDDTRAAVEQVRPQVICHLATHGAYPFQPDARRALLVNVMGLWNLLEACAKVGFELFVNTGSSSEYGRKSAPMRETDLLEPESFYAVAKSAQSLLCRHTAGLHDLPIVTLRLFSVYGPYEEPTRLVPKVMLSLLEGRTLDMVSPETSRDFIHVDDVVDLYLAIERLKPLRGEIINVGTGVQTTLADFVEMAGGLGAGTLAVRWGAMQPRQWDTDVWVADTDKARRLVGFHPKISLPEGLRLTLDWCRENAHLYRR
jgi:nucleoside-diphosphate-sugar epimerase